MQVLIMKHLVQMDKVSGVQVVKVELELLLVQPVAEEDRQVRDGLVRVLKEHMVGLADYHLI